MTQALHYCKTITSSSSKSANLSLLQQALMTYGQNCCPQFCYHFIWYRLRIILHSLSGIIVDKFDQFRLENCHFIWVILQRSVRWPILHDLSILRQLIDPIQQSESSRWIHCYKWSNSFLPRYAKETTKEYKHMTLIYKIHERINKITRKFGSHSFVYVRKYKKTKTKNPLFSRLQLSQLQPHLLQKSVKRIVDLDLLQ